MECVLSPQDWCNQGFTVTLFKPLTQDTSNMLACLQPGSGSQCLHVTVPIRRATLKTFDWFCNAGFI